MTKKTPIRTCVACGEAADKRELVRIVRTPSGEVELDTTGKAAGRGAYLHLSAKCMQNACARRLLDRHLRCKVSAEGYERLEDEMRTLLAAASAR